ncbi:MAG: heat-inducible transcriptional repressor HrcA [Chloroflexi bacterium]|nr:heat-inducible transcriptional repressor HrcA [Chloroflexota bacterium]
MSKPTANPAAPSLNTRRQALLEIIVSDYIETAAPVSSQQLARRYELRVSPATIRNDMAELEEMGYISRPHTSAGGVPSDPGYRFYVERARQRNRLPRHFQERVRDAIDFDEADPAAWARSAARVLASAVHNLAIATTVKRAVARVKQLQIVHLHDREALLVVVMQDAQLRQRIIHLDSDTTQDELTQIANRLNRLIGGMSAAELRTLWDSGFSGGNVIIATLMETIRVLSDEERRETRERYLNGLSHMLSQPEFQSGKSAHDAAEVLDDDSITRIFDDSPRPAEVRVVIGQESHEEHLRPYSVVYATYGAPDGATGVIGAMGPTRMDYARAMSSVRYLAAFLSELVQALEPSQPWQG